MIESLKRFSTGGKFLMLALDHRGSFRRFVKPDRPEAAKASELIAAKHEIIYSLKDKFSGLLIDVDYGLPAYSGSKPYLLPLEESGYSDEAGQRLSKLELTAAELAELGAGGAKLLIYFNPNLSSAAAQLKTAAAALDDCKAAGLPLFLEIVTYDLAGTKDIVPELIYSSVEAFKQAGIVPDVWKLEYPGSQEACAKLTKLCQPTPWILLSRGAAFDAFAPQVEAAATGGAAGFLAGRALWQDLFGLSGKERTDFLSDTLPERFERINRSFH